MPSSSPLPVLVAGAGPAGLTTAITLARHGVACQVVDRRRAPSPWPRATAVSTASMELLRSWGLEPAIRARALEAEWRMWMCETLADAAAGRPLPTGMPTAEQSAVVSPTRPACLGQDELEAVLREHLVTLPAAELVPGTEIAGVTSDDDGAEVVLRDVDSGACRTVRARYVVGADGAHSAVRNGLGIAMRGPDQLADRLSILFRAPGLWDRLDGSRYGIYAITAGPRDNTVMLPCGRDDRWLLAIMWDPARERIDNLTPQRLAAFVAQATGMPDLEPVFERVGHVAFAAQLADRFRAGSAFLIGDAAHRVSPRGGTGMSTAIGDGADLGWKLAWVLRGWADPALLDTYETERRPAAEHNVARSAAPDGTLRDADRALHADLGGRLAHHWVAGPGDERISTLDLLGPGLTLLTGPHGTAWAQAAAALDAPVPVDVHALDAFTARALGLRADGALLARPDGLPAGWWPCASAAASGLRVAVQAVATPPMAATAPARSATG